MDTGGGPDSSPQRPCFPQHPSPPSPGAPTGLLEAPGFSWVVPMAAAGGGGLGEGRREGEAGPAAGRCYPAERESTMPAAAGSGTTARPKPPGLRNNNSNQSSGWWASL